MPCHPPGRKIFTGDGSIIIGKSLTMPRRAAKAFGTGRKEKGRGRWTLIRAADYKDGKSIATKPGAILLLMKFSIPPLPFDKRERKANRGETGLYPHLAVRLPYIREGASTTPVKVESFSWKFDKSPEYIVNNPIDKTNENGYY